MNKKYIIGNWKMLPETWAEAEQILESLNGYLSGLGDRFEPSVVICPPFVFIEEVRKTFDTTSLGQYLSLGAQDISLSDSEMVTGEISGQMLQGLGVRYVIVGHSERRWKLGETDETVNRKLKTAIKNGFIPIVCLGETERNGNYKEFLSNQITGTFEGLTAEEIGNCLIAYEPVWAISTNPGAKPDTPQNALESIREIREILIENFKLSAGRRDGKTENLPRVLYGGSVNSANAKSFLNIPEICGVLVGGASVKKDEFIKILSLLP